MYTQCPECLTVFALDAASVAQARGSVRCGHCSAVFDAIATLTEALPPEPFDSLPAHTPSPAPPQLVEPVYRPQAPQQGLFAPVDPLHGGHAPAAPAFARRHGVAHGGHPGRWAAGCALLALALGAQLAWAQRDALIASDALRPWLARACRPLACTLPPVKDVHQLSLISRDIRPHPSVPGALIISATLRNDADFTQPYPVLGITLSDLDENRVAMRRFLPAEYVRDPRLRAAGLAPGAEAALVFEVEDPGKNAVAFEFNFE
ncbi:MAG: zinc-ribbon and DUF3426 domain-containing protein [Mizugakiibacter sp.]|uniref:zinc-ribbon and DUF3426 domain-containing protein n=1 Tax=Mizugakiibacter sp. TaxID=1972610 RepID=UPI0031C5CFB3|nr:zinc-ribbon and DUF3426 domain-containing protein [Xanthomonadaceae bacterium]